MAAVLLAPLLVQVDQHVQVAVELQFRMDVEVGVHFQEAARLDLMRSAAAEVGIGDQAVDAGEGLEEEQHLEAVHGVEETADAVGDRARLVEEPELFLARVVEAHPGRLLRRREIPQHPRRAPRRRRGRRCRCAESDRRPPTSRAARADRREASWMRHSSARIEWKATMTVAEASSTSVTRTVIDSVAAPLAPAAPAAMRPGFSTFIQATSAFHFHVSSAAQPAAMMR